MSSILCTICLLSLNGVYGQVQVNTLTGWQPKVMSFNAAGTKLAAAGGGIYTFDTSNADASTWPATFSFSDGDSNNNFIAAAYSGDGNWAAFVSSGSSTDSISIYRVSDMTGSGGNYVFKVLTPSRTIQNTNYVQSRINALVFSPDSSLLISTYCVQVACEVHMWKTNTWTAKTGFMTPVTTPDYIASVNGTNTMNQLQSVTIHPSGSWLVVGASGGVAYVYAVMGNFALSLSSTLNTMPNATSQSGGSFPAKTFVSFSPDGTMLAVSFSYDGSYIYPFSLANGVGTKTVISDTSIYGQQSDGSYNWNGNYQITGISFSVDSSKLAVVMMGLGANPSTVKVWSNFTQPTLSMKFTVSSNTLCLTFSGNKYLLTSGMDSNTNGIAVWQLDMTTTTTTSTSTPTTSTSTSTTTTVAKSSGAATTTLPCPQDMGVAAGQTFATCKTNAGTNQASLCSCATAYLNAMSGCVNMGGMGMPQLPSLSQYCPSTTAPKSTSMASPVVVLSGWILSLLAAALHI